MADDVRIATSLRKHRKTKRLRRLLGGDGCWALICLFLWAGEERWTGDLSGLSDDDIEEESDWAGQRGALIAALLEVKFIAGDAGARTIHDWIEHNPYAAHKGDRIEKGRQAANARWNATSIKTNGSSMPTACGENATPPIEQCPPAPAPTLPNSKAVDQKLSSSGKPDDPSPEAEKLSTATRDAIEAFNNALAKPAGLLPQVKSGVGFAKRQAQVRRCLSVARDISREQYGGALSPLFWADYFGGCAADPFLSGRQSGGRGHENWTPDFEYLTRPETVLKTYDRISQ